LTYYFLFRNIPASGRRLSINLEKLLVLKKSPVARMAADSS
jgi:hypothetical protein